MGSPQDENRLLKSLDASEVYRGLEVAQAMWGTARFNEIPPFDILAVIEQTAHPSMDKREWSGCCC